ncbi:hypothetical protein Sulfitobl28_01960 [Sulfitobacter pontiacus]|nr:hypothetical protein Sulfitobl28_01960 [Sulfitobacter pontiacus]
MSCVPTALASSYHQSLMSSRVLRSASPGSSQSALVLSRLLPDLFVSIAARSVFMGSQRTVFGLDRRGISRLSPTVP